ncbi:unnamed protein product [Adineta steineri]|uniref:Uncharacterized protein n=2 Tax=Adineta steineri TaxID=433720 RepID=A0A814XYQ1_9BILA|nr:unnamed protein product [Adineta steineri]
MMKLKALLFWIKEQIVHYNLFMKEENEYDDDNANIEENDPAIVLKQQKYTTWFYILLLLGTTYILFYATVIKQQTRTITISNITLTVFNELYLEHGETLSCPCSNVAITYQAFVDSSIKFHPVCSSIFITQKWIEALYLKNPSEYGTGDFRSTAYSQFQLLADLCSLSEKIVFQNKNDLSNNELVTSDLLPDFRIHSKVNDTVQFFKNGASTRIIAFMNYVRATIRANYLVSALNTNFLIEARNSSDGYKLLRTEVFIKNSSANFSRSEFIGCSTKTPTAAVSLFPLPIAQNYSDMALYQPSAYTNLANGFFAACTPLEALLQSTLDCLYSIECVELLKNYFPAIALVNSTVSVISLKREYRSVSDHLLNLFLEEWSTQTNYSRYFKHCAPAFFFLMTRMRKIGRWMRQLNLFKAADRRTEKDVKQQKISTRLYLILLTGASLFLIINEWNAEVVTVTEPNPSLVTYNNLQDLYNTTLRCPCSDMTIPYERFLSLSPIFHKVCSSDFVTDQWISLLKKIATGYNAPDWRNTASLRFQFLADLCKLADTTINDAVHDFRSQPFIASSVMNENDFNKQLNATLDQFFRSTMIYFSILIKTVRILTQVDQSYFGSTASNQQYPQEDKLSATFEYNKSHYVFGLKVAFRLTGLRHVNPLSFSCICATDINCNSSIGIYETDYSWSLHPEHIHRYTVPGWVERCSTTDSLMFSTLECYYSNSDCLSILQNYSKKTYLFHNEYGSWFDIHPLIYNSTTSSFPPNTSISTIIEAIMIERWNSSSSYNQFYKSCAPSYCTYAKRIRRTIVEVMIKLISMISGLILLLRLLTPQLVKLIFYLLTKICKRQQQQEQEEQPHVRSRWSRLRAIMQKIVTLLYDNLANLNIFLVRDFGSKVDRITAKRLGQWATLLYIVLFLISMIGLTLYFSMQPKTQTDIFDKPSLDLYERLFQRYGNQLKCSCSSIVSTNGRFVKLEAVFHDICSSPFASDEGRIALTSDLFSDLSAYSLNDYRRFLSAHLQFLTGLCQLSMNTTKISIEDFHSSLFVAAELLSEKKLRERLNLMTETSKADAYKTFISLLFLIRSINHGNAFMSTYGTNFKYDVPLHILQTKYLQTTALIDENGCSCGLYPNCTTSAKFFEKNASTIIAIEGLKMGCTPSESFLASTFECFYNQSCLNILRQYTSMNMSQINSTSFLHPLSRASIRFPKNTRIEKIVNDLFIEEWNITVDYSSYFDQCLPLLCSYTYTPRYNIFNSITDLLSIQGGLTIALAWICPKLVRIINAIYQYRKKRANTIRAITTISTENVNTNAYGSTSNSEVISRNVTPQSSDLPDAYSHAIGDFNDDGRLDLALVNKNGHNVHVLVGNGNGTFGKEITSPEVYTGLLDKMSIGDFNNDNRLDLAGMKRFDNYVDIFHGNGDGILIKYQSVLAGYGSTLSGIAVGHFNNDHYLDIAVAVPTKNRISVLFANRFGTFLDARTYETGINSYPSDIAVADFNHDGHQDIAVVNKYSRTIGIFLGNTNGSFEDQKTSFTGAGYDPQDFAVGDLNSDGVLDTVVTYNGNNLMKVIYGHGYGRMSDGVSFHMLGASILEKIFIRDFNRDGHLDIGFGKRGNEIILYVGDGNGNFEAQTLFSIRNPAAFRWLGVGDFDGDGYDDVILWMDQPTYYEDASAVSAESTQPSALPENFRKRKLIWIIFSILVVVLSMTALLIVFTAKKTNDNNTSIPERSTIETTTEPSTTKTVILETMKTTSKEQLPPSVIISSKTKWKQNAITVAGGYGQGNELNQLNEPYGIHVDDDSIYIADTENHRVVRWEFSADKGEIVAGGNEKGSGMHQLNYPVDVVLDKEKKYIIICDKDNQRVMRWSLQNKEDQLVLIDRISCHGLAMNNNGDLYISDWNEQKVIRWQQEPAKSIVVAGANGVGSHFKQLKNPTYIFVDEYHTVYVVDSSNRRVMKWMENATEGIRAARGPFSDENFYSYLFPISVIADHMGNIYVSDDRFHEIMRWSVGATEGAPVVGQENMGSGPTQLAYPFDLSFDRHGNLYVVDYRNSRIQKFLIDLD